MISVRRHIIIRDYSDITQTRKNIAHSGYCHISAPLNVTFLSHAEQSRSVTGLNSYQYSIIMKKPNIFISGPSIIANRKLVNTLQIYATVHCNEDNSRIESIFAKRKIDLLLLEICDQQARDIQTIRRIKAQHPEIEIILVDGNSKSEVISAAIHAGARDAFRKPYREDLMVDRILSLLKSRA